MVDVNQEVWDAINETPRIPEETKKSLHVKIMRIIERSKSPVGKKLGVTVMTQEASLAGDQAARNKKHKGNPGESKPKNL